MDIETIRKWWGRFKPILSVITTLTPTPVDNLVLEFLDKFIMSDRLGGEVSAQTAP